MQKANRPKKLTPALKQSNKINKKKEKMKKKTGNQEGQYYLRTMATLCLEMKTYKQVH